jgi:hypothetical protein
MQRMKMEATSLQRSTNHSRDAIPGGGSLLPFVLCETPG